MGLFKRETRANKLTAVILIIIGYIPIHLYKEGTVFLLMLFFGVPLLFAKENWMQY